MDTQPPPVTHAAVAFAVAAAQRADQLSSRSMDLLERADTLLASSARRLDPS